MAPRPLVALLAVTTLLGAVTSQAQEALPSLGAGTFNSTVFSGSRGLILGHNGEPNRFSNIRFELHADFNWYSAFGVGGRLEFPVAPWGILEGVDDELALSFGAEVFFFYNPNNPGFGVYPIAAVQWNFYLGQVSLFPELGVAFLFGPNRQGYWPSFISPYIGFGFRYHFNARNALLLRASWPAGLQVGVTF
jgi:hypothetical protein